MRVGLLGPAAHQGDHMLGTATERRTTTYATTENGSVVRRVWRDRVVYVSVLRPGTRRATFVGMVDSVVAGGYRAVGVTRRLNAWVQLGDQPNYIDAETVLLTHRSGRVSQEEWAPPTKLVRQAAARAELARRRALMAVDGRGFSIADLVADL